MGLDNTNPNLNVINNSDRLSKHKLAINTIYDKTIGDTGTIDHCLTLDAPCDNEHPISSPILICMPNGQILQSIHNALVKDKSLSIKA